MHAHTHTHTHARTHTHTHFVRMPISILEGTVVLSSDHTLSQQTNTAGMESQPSLTFVCLIQLCPTHTSSSQHCPTNLSTPREGGVREGVRSEKGRSEVREGAAIYTALLMQMVTAAKGKLHTYTRWHMISPNLYCSRVQWSYTSVCFQSTHSLQCSQPSRCTIVNVESAKSASSYMGSQTLHTVVETAFHTASACLTCSISDCSPPDDSLLPRSEMQCYPAYTAE